MNFKEARDRWVELTLKKREIQSTLDDVQKELSAMNVVLSDLMRSEGLQNFRIDGVGLISLRTQVRASVTDQGLLKETMEKHGLETLLTVHTAKVKSLIADPDTEPALLSDLEKCVNTSEVKIPTLRK